jgi:prolyl oligopeptidase
MCHLHRTVLVMLALLALSVEAQTLKKPPATRQDNVREVIHGAEIVDPYRWLEDQDDPQTRKWIDAQDTYTHSLLDQLPARDTIRRRLTELSRVDRSLAPTERNGRYFFSKRR